MTDYQWKIIGNSLNLETLEKLIEHYLVMSEEFGGVSFYSDLHSALEAYCNKWSEEYEFISEEQIKTEGV